jgi:putative transposase
VARPLRITYPGAFYHVTSRGNEKKDVFKSRRDREKFLEYLASATARYGALIHAYCLMSNHYHLLLETPGCNLSQIMQHINSAYTTYFNIKRKRAGHLFQGRFKAILVEADEYATELSRYIHLNPVRAGIAGNPVDYPWSSYRSYVGRDNAPEWLKREFIFGYFGKRATDAMKNYRAFVEELLGEEYESPLKNTYGTAILGTAGFIETITATHITTREANRDLPALRQFATGPSLDKILTAVNTVVGNNEKLARQAGMYFCHKYSGEKLRTIGEVFNVQESAISKAGRTFPRKMEKDKELNGVIERIRGMLAI